jgi:hypothetical protein
MPASVLRTACQVRPCRLDRHEMGEVFDDPIARREVEAALTAGERVFVEFQLLAEVAEDGEVHRVGGTTWGAMPVPLEPNPASQLATEVYEGRLEHIGDLVGDIRMAYPSITRWSVYSAPFRIEVHPALANLRVALDN